MIRYFINVILSMRKSVCGGFQIDSKIVNHGTISNWRLSIHQNGPQRLLECTAPLKIVLLLSKGTSDVV